MSNGLPLNEEERRLGELVREALGNAPSGPFQPLVFYDTALDRSIVLNEDRSGTEVRIEDNLTIMEANHPRKGEPGRKPVGFTIECASSYCKHFGLLRNGQVDLNEVLDSLLIAAYPSLSYQVDVARRVLSGVEVSTVKLT